MKIPQSVIKPFGYTGMPWLRHDFTEWDIEDLERVHARMPKELKDAIDDLLDVLADVDAFASIE